MVRIPFLGIIKKGRGGTAFSPANGKKKAVGPGRAIHGFCSLVYFRRSAADKPLL
jgi:hypothetical protein